jgi:hypothetical protein
MATNPTGGALPARLVSAPPWISRPARYGKMAIATIATYQGHPTPLGSTTRRQNFPTVS